MTKSSRTHFEEQKHTMLQRVLDGSISVDSIQEFENILEIYPSEPLLFRQYADLLSKTNSQEKAYSVYDQAANLFIERGMNLQAIVAKILQWSIRKPSHTEGRRFHSLLHEEGARHTPLHRFWTRMTYPELVAIMLRLVRVRLPSGVTILSHGENVEHIFFVVSGTLSETAVPDCVTESNDAAFETEPTTIGPNDIFGDIFPIDQPTASPVEIRTVSDVELVKISKKILNSACRTYPHIEKLLKELHKTERHPKSERPWQTVRRTIRFGLPTQVNIIGHSAKQPRKQWRHDGIAMDLSIGGMCIDLGPNSPPEECGQLRGQVIQAFLNLHDDSTMSLTGIIAWHRKQSNNALCTHQIGVRFDPLSHFNRRRLTDYCSEKNSEQNLLWSLWDSMVRVDNI